MLGCADETMLFEGLLVDVVCILELGGSALPYLGAFNK
jgi:hypothetical protein